MAAKLPDKVKIGLFDYAVEESLDAVEDHRHSTGEDVYGLTDLVNGTITLNPRMTGSRKPVTLVHEVFHAIWDATGLASLEEYDEETAVKIISPMLVQVLRENPKLVKYILEGE